MKSSSVSYVYIYIFKLLYCYIIPCSQSQLKSRSLQPVLSKHSPHSLKPCVAEEIPDVSAKSLATTAHFISKNVRITHQWRPPLWPLLCSSRDLFWFQFQSGNCVLQPRDGISPFSKRVEKWLTTQEFITIKSNENHVYKNPTQSQPVILLSSSLFTPDS